MGLQGINTAYSGIRAAQAAMDTISHNIANMSVEGYTRQRVELGSVFPFESQVGLIGTGVDVIDIARTRESLLDERARTENGRLGFFEARLDLLAQAEGRLGQLDAGVDVALTELFTQLEELALQPDRAPVRTAVLGAMEGMATRMRETVTSIAELQEQTILRINARGQEFNDLIVEIARLNKEIVGLTSTGSANDLMDQRDILIDELANGLGANVIQIEGGMVRVSVNGLSLVDGQVATKLVIDKATGEITHPDTGPTPLVPGGELGGLHFFLNTDLPALLQNFDDLATNIADEFNAQNALGFVDDGTGTNTYVAGGDLFDASSGASNFTVAITDPSLIAAGQTGPGVVTPPPNFDGRNAQALADLRTKVLADGRSINEQYRDLITDWGVRTKQADDQTTGQTILYKTVNRSRENQHGVDMNEELTNLVSQQRALEASSRVLTAMDEILSTLIHNTGRVGT